MRVLIFVLGVFFTVGIGQAFADTYEFYTYGGYDAAVTAWNRVALIFSDKEFSVLALTAIILGALILFYSLLLKTAIGVNISLFRGWMVPFIGSLVVVSALVLPKDKLVIYDPVLNRGPQEISGIPKVLALTAYVTNKVERAFIKIIDTLAIDEYAKYERNAGGLSYKITTDLFSSLPPAKEYFYKTAENYVKDCILFEIGRSGGGTINMEKLLKGEITFLDAINLAKNPAVNTKYYDTDGTEKVADCATAGNVLISYINQEKNIGSQTSLIFNHLRSACRASEVENVADCERLLSYAVNKIANAMSSGIGPVTLDLVWYQYIMTTIAEDVFAKNDLSYALRTFATRQTMSTLWGLGQHANSWIPVLKSVFTALAIGISPFVILLMATPLAGRALMVLFGLYLWLLCWGVIDAAIFSFGNDFAVKFAPSLTNYGSGVGMAFAMSLPSVSAKTVAVFGAMRWAGLGLATFFTTMLVRFGGTVLALAAGQIASSVPMSSGASMGESLGARPLEVAPGFTSLPRATAETGMVLGGTRPYLSSLTSAERSRLFDSITKGAGFEDSLGKTGFSRLFLGHTLHHSLGYSGTVGRVETMERVFGFSGLVNLQPEEKGYFYGKYSGNEKGFLTATVAYGALKHMAKRNFSNLSEEDKRILLGGSVVSGLIVAEKLLNQKVVDVGEVGEGFYKVAVRTDAGAVLFSYDLKGDKMTILEVSDLPQNFKLDSKFIRDYIKEKAARDIESIKEEWGIVSRTSKKSELGTIIDNTYKREFSHSLMRRLEDLIAKNKEFAKMWRDFGMSAKEIYGAVEGGISGSFPILPFIKAKIEAKAGSRYSSKWGEETSEQAIDRFSNVLQSAINESEAEASVKTFSTMRRLGYSIEDVVSYLKSIGANKLADLAKNVGISETAGSQLSHALTTYFVNYWADKYHEGDVFKAMRDIGYKLASGETDKLYEEARKFLDDKLKDDQFVREIDTALKNRELQIESQINELEKKVDNVVPSQTEINPKELELVRKNTPLPLGVPQQPGKKHSKSGIKFSEKETSNALEQNRKKVQQNVESSFRIYLEEWPKMSAKGTDKYKEKSLDAR